MKVQRILFLSGTNKSGFIKQLLVGKQLEENIGFRSVNAVLLEQVPLWARFNISGYSRRMSKAKSQMYVAVLDRYNRIYKQINGIEYIYNFSKMDFIFALIPMVMLLPMLVMWIAKLGRRLEHQNAPIRCCPSWWFQSCHLGKMGWYSWPIKLNTNGWCTLEWAWLKHFKLIICQSNHNLCCWRVI